MNIVKTLFKNTVWLGLAQIFNTITGILISVLLARYLGDVDYGKYVFVISFVHLFSVLLNFGFSNYFVNEISQNKSKLKDYLQNTLFIKIFISFLFLLIIFIAVNFSGKSEEVRNYVYIMSVSLIFTSFLDLYYSVFRSHNKMSHQTLFMASVSIFNLLFIIIGVYLDLSLYFILLVFFASYFINFILASIFIHRNYVTIGLKFNPKLCKKLIISVLPFILSAVFVRIYHDMDQVMLSFMKGDQVTGWYGADYKILMAINMLGGVYYSVYHPVVARLYKRNKEKLETLVKATIKMTYLLVIPAAVGVSILAKKIIVLFYGSEYQGGTLALQILIWSIVFTLVNQAFGRIMQASKNMKAYTFAIGIGALINIIANIILIPLFSLEGAAIATVISLCSVFVFMYLFFYKHIFKINIFKYIFKPVAASIFMGIFIYYLMFLNFNVILLIMIGVINYFAMAFLIKGMEIKDVKLFKDVLIAKK